jgi:hypothetical protein
MSTGRPGSVGALGVSVGARSRLSTPSTTARSVACSATLVASESQVRARWTGSCEGSTIGGWCCTPGHCYRAETAAALATCVCPAVSVASTAMSAAGSASADAVSSTSVSQTASASSR